MIALRFLVALVLVAAAISPAPAEDRPNIVFIMIDDLGWMDLACQGNKLVETPHIDRLASEGVRFTDAYSAAPVCSPTRASILTGKSPARLHITNHIPDRESFSPDEAPMTPAKMLDHLPLEEETIAERLKESGYRTAFMGKWHLSGHGRMKDGGKGSAEFSAEHQGFDINIGGCAYGGPPSFFDPYRIHNLPDRKKGEYLPDRLTDEAVGFMKQNREDPFLLFLWNYTVHWPMEAPEHLLKKYENRKGRGLNDTRYGAMIEAMDGAIGRLLAAIDELGLRERTLVVFTSDNGGFGGVSDGRPLRESKGHLYEGGIRVPLIVRWPGVTKPGTTSAEPVISTDWFPTLLEVAGVKPKPEVPADGESLMPLLKGEGRLSRNAIYFHAPNYAFHGKNRLGGAIRQREYKLIERYADGSVELYDLSRDIGEGENLAGQKPEVVSRLRRKLWQWRLESGAVMPTPKKKS